MLNDYYYLNDCFASAYKADRPFLSGLGKNKKYTKKQRMFIRAKQMQVFSQVVVAFQYSENIALKGG